MQLLNICVSRGFSKPTPSKDAVKALSSQESEPVLALIRTIASAVDVVVCAFATYNATPFLASLSKALADNTEMPIPSESLARIDSCLLQLRDIGHPSKRLSGAIGFVDFMSGFCEKLKHAISGLLSAEESHAAFTSLETARKASRRQRGLCQKLHSTRATG